MSRLDSALAELAAAIREEVAEAAAAANGHADELLDAEAACRRLGGIARSTLYDLTGRGELRSLTVGRRRFWPATYVAEYLADRAPPGEAA
jgi:hypothetical protein